jgi:Metal binding domain of Ada
MMIILKKFLLVAIISVLLVSMVVLSVEAQGNFVAVKDGSVYHYPDCTYLSNTLESNKIYFATVEAAQEQGLTSCLRCKPPTTSVSSISPTESTPLPTISNQPTNTQLSDPTSTPTVPELMPVTLILALVAVSSVALVAKKKLQVKR